MRAISCSIECLWLFLEGTPSAFPSHTMASSIEFINTDMCLCMQNNYLYVHYIVLKIILAFFCTI